MGICLRHGVGTGADDEAPPQDDGVSVETARTKHSYYFLKIFYNVWLRVL